MHESPAFAAQVRLEPELSIVVPMYDEESNVAAFVEAVSGVLAGASLARAGR
jgi:hypothetical protein